MTDKDIIAAKDARIELLRNQLQDAERRCEMLVAENLKHRQHYITVTRNLSPKTLYQFTISADILSLSSDTRMDELKFAIYSGLAQALRHLSGEQALGEYIRKH